MKITIAAKYIPALLITAQKSGSTRPHLESLFIRGDKIITTDGFRLSILHLDYTYPVTATIPRTLFDALKIGNQGMVDIDIDGQDVSIWYAGVVSSGKLCTETYLDTSRIVRAAITNEVCQFDAKYLTDLLKISKLLHPGSKCHLPTIHHCGDRGIVDFKDSNYYHLIMGLRPKCDYFYIVPAWAE